MSSPTAVCETDKDQQQQNNAAGDVGKTEMSMESALDERSSLTAEGDDIGEEQLQQNEAVDDAL